MQGRLRKKKAENIHENFRTWMRFLTLTNNAPKNREMLSEYFLVQCTSSPEVLQTFLNVLHKTLEREQRTKINIRLATLYLHILSPLCERFGLFAEKTLLDSLCFFIVSPGEYRTVERYLTTYQRKSHDVIRTIRTVLDTLLKKRGHACEIQGRYKSLYSIYGKLQRKGHESPLALRDIFAFRIILKNNNAEECFDVLNLLHDLFQPVAECFKDYITIPKANGYQSLHTVLSGITPAFDLPVEIQIRSRAMHEFAEEGFASHWVYARAKEMRILTEKERKILSHFLFLSEHAQQEQMLLCLSPDGDIVKLPPGATAIDFAYQIHTKLGDRARAARINGRLRDIRAPLKNADCVAIVSDVAKHGRSDWIAHASLSSTRKKIYENSRR
ncbi:hypothetical protein A3C37_00250 [Candidatus Peribacteria bacterium RIFCSPHIGHO2_02_FULL_53_20]|nr:MAG: hypothetical protein A3C37_00250 [Candidatus Peribacteria bacterium RIFCSPHIGHO2_02_FULL_53_20]OGJ67007.1 MAG: hypothetical protein A3B61_04565 [Candidatus Peribacteria bacterium RIFCSPLOWO2_01_FULL_53_10]OGJ71697.1 MAG: hypothetical protein A3G69_04145 [Candidatus Peribacteria bacterium RIFCSPLOWO2_12_FULL_53_10]